MGGAAEWTPWERTSLWGMRGREAGRDAGAGRARCRGRRERFMVRTDPEQLRSYVYLVYENAERMQVMGLSASF